MTRILALAAALFIALSASLAAQEGGREGASGLKVPRFVSFKNSPVNMREGPSTDTPVKWVYQRKGLPVEIIEEFDNWRKVRDSDGETGWVHRQMLDGARTGLIVGREIATLHREPDAASPAVAFAQPGLVGRLKRCEGGFCEISARGYTGWVARAQLWGVYPDEVVE